MDLTRFVMLRLQGAPFDRPITNGKSSPKPPPAPDPRVQIEAEARARPSTFTPYGNAVYSGNPADGTFREDISLAEPEQKRLDSVRRISQAQLDSLNPNYEFDGATDPTTNRVYTAQKELLDKGFDREEERLGQRLANQGIPMGSEAYATEMENFRESRAAADRQAAAGALDQGYRQDLTTRQQQYAELAALLGASPSMPTAGGGVDVASAFGNAQAGRNAAYQGQVAGHQADVGTTNAALGAAGAVGGSYLMASAFI